MTVMVDDDDNDDDEETAWYDLVGPDNNSGYGASVGGSLRDTSKNVRTTSTTDESRVKTTQKAQLT
jgi:hypothetical protein